MPSLILCAACQRHVRCAETTCPFCGAERQPSAVGCASAAGRISKRAALIAASVSLGVAACDDSNDVPIYGAPGVLPGGGSAGQGASAGRGGSAGVAGSAGRVGSAGTANVAGSGGSGGEGADDTPGDAGLDAASSDAAAGDAGDAALD